MRQLIFISLLMSLFIIAVSLHRKFFDKKFSQGVYYIIWVIIALRLILFFDISTDKSITVLNPGGDAYVENLEFTEERYKNIAALKNIERFNEGYRNEFQEPVRGEKKSIDFKAFFRRNLFKMWLIGFGIYLFYNFFSI